MIKFGRQRSLSLIRSHEQNGGWICDGHNNCTRFTLHIRPLIALMVKKSFRGFTSCFTLLFLCYFVCHFFFNSLLANFKVSLASLISALSCSI